MVINRLYYKEFYVIYIDNELVERTKAELKMARFSIVQETDKSDCKVR